MERLKTLVILVLLGVIAGGAVWAATSTETEVRIVARRLDDGRTEFGLQQRVDGEWSEEQLPRSRYFPAEVSHDRWLRSSPLRLTVAAPEVDTQSMTEDPPAEPVAPESAGEDEAGDSNEDDSSEDSSPSVAVSSYEPVEVEYNEWDTGTSQGIYRWQGSELRYAAGDGSAYVWSSFTTTNTGGGISFRLSCLVGKTALSATVSLCLTGLEANTGSSTATPPPGDGRTGTRMAGRMLCRSAGRSVILSGSETVTAEW